MKIIVKYLTIKLLIIAVLSLSHKTPSFDLKCSATQVKHDETKSSCLIHLQKIDSKATTHTFEPKQIFWVRNGTIKTQLILAFTSKNLNVKVNLLKNDKFDSSLPISFKLESYDFNERKFIPNNTIKPNDTYVFVYSKNQVIKIDFLYKQTNSESLSDPNEFDNFLPKGLLNSGTQCYYNSIIQTLNSYGFIKKIINNFTAFKSSPSPSNNVNTKFLGRLKLVFYYLQHNKPILRENKTKKIHKPNKQKEIKTQKKKIIVDTNKPVNATFLYESNPFYEKGVQEDAHEFFISTLNMIEEIDKIEKIKKLMYFKVKYEYKEYKEYKEQKEQKEQKEYKEYKEYKEQKGKHPILSTAEEEFSFMSLDLEKEETALLKDLINNFFKTSIISDYKYKDKSYDVEKHSQILSYPKILLLHLKRFNYDNK